MLLCAVVYFSCWSPVAVAATDCTPRADRLLRRIDVDVNRDTRVTRTVDIPADTRLLIEIVEKDIDTRLEVRDAGSESRSTDGPLRRWAPERLLIAAGSARKLELTVVGQERVRGSAQVRLFRLGSDDDPKCVEFWGTMAAADADYSRAELINELVTEAPEGTLDRFYQAATTGYARAASMASTRGGLPVAQAQLAYAVLLLTTTEEWKKAADAALVAERQLKALGNDYGVERARFFWARAVLQDALHNPSEAEANKLFELAKSAFLSVAENHRQRGERYDYAFALVWAAYVNSNSDRYAETIAGYQRALSAFEGLDEPARKVQIRNNLAHIEFNLGRYSQALKHYTEALKDADPVNELEMYTYILKNVAFTEQTLGKYDSALRHYSEALALSTRAQNDWRKGYALQGLGNTYRAIGNFTEALSYLGRALELRPADRAPIERVATLRSIADVLGESGRARDAIAHREEALRLAQGAPLRARVTLELISDRIRVGDLVRAKSLLADLQATPDLADPAIRAGATLENAQIALAEGRLAVAVRDSRIAAEQFRAQELIVKEFGALLVQARAACATGAGSEALEFAQRALDRAEEIRVSSNNPALRASLWRPVRPAFEFTIGVLARPRACAGDLHADPLAALAIAEKSRGRALEDFRRKLAGDANAQLEVNARRRELFEHLASRRQQIQILTEEVSQDDARLRLLRAEVANMSREIDLTGGQVALPQARIDDLRPALRARIDALPRDTAVVEYWLGGTDAFAWLLTRGRVQLVDLGSARRIDAAARSLHDGMRSWTMVSADERLRRARDLHALIIAPLPPEFRRAHTAYFIPDGTLHSVPFAALASEAGAHPRFLVDSHDVAVAPAFLAIGSDSEPRPIRRNSAALVVADPVYTNEDTRFAGRLARAAPAPVSATTFRGARSWSRLPATAREAAAITKLLAPGSVQVLSGFDANRDILLARDLARYDILHFATHAIADSEAPQLSALVLSTFDAQGKPRVGEVFAGDLADQRLGAALVVLSGCETALGLAEAGEGLLGLRYAAHASGARTVVASLWPVMDAAGASLMDDLYTDVIGRNASPVAAMSRAMRSARKRWDDPALWAAFDVSIAGF